MRAATLLGRNPGSNGGAPAEHASERGNGVHGSRGAPVVCLLEQQLGIGRVDAGPHIASAGDAKGEDGAAEEGSRAGNKEGNGDKVRGIGEAQAKGTRGAGNAASSASSGSIVRKFCGCCGSSLEWSGSPDYPDWASIAIATLDTPFTPKHITEIYTDTKPCWLG